MEWQDISTAPKDRMILVYGKPGNIVGLSSEGPSVHVAYWDNIDKTFCLDVGIWLSPSVEPTHWQPLPEPPAK